MLKHVVVVAVLLMAGFVTKVQAAPEVSEADQLLMARIVYAEGASESLEAKKWIAAVILNRTETKGYPKTIRGVIYQKNAFSCVTDGNKLWAASATPALLKGKSREKWLEAQKAVREIVIGRPNTNAIAYRRADCKGGESYFRKLKLVARIGSHNFYKE